ncbi:putative carbon-monoxide dehydrogenase, middle subunit [[Clostridium] ultunense Esp]|uniref:Putative carbon-monoxide dehydrogenase, middle subunit n=1 Tax=[Clostridium] ultunense Esp TaxID=1288971 RepID=M1ZL61_9FIRM|nr:FAD binding domain-containing protein [Schnuerera ultunensis]CCQ96642.1 putative carbon-monoxide dehydrogenase, middle subunit [[Clostridium] ultunense Esp]SHD77499.1 putative carbon-monoxide dehydrogenase, middle subunit [[Clostridium] ultunense Esp]
MIPFNFDYYKPNTLTDAINLYTELDSMGKSPIYYGGGTEFISMARVHNVHTKAVIDIKGIPECNIHVLKNTKLTIGSAITLTNIAIKNHFPLLSRTVKRIADHTIQDKITLGGNLAGTIIYKESLLPLMVANANIVLEGINGSRTVPIMDVFCKEMNISKEELIVQVIIDERYLNLPSLHVKRTKNEKIDYPLITLVALVDQGKINIAFSGLSDFPFRTKLLEDILNDESFSKDERIKKFINNIPYKILDDLAGSSEYRKFMLNVMLNETLENLQEAL